jgi:hypothetical protein
VCENGWPRYLWSRDSFRTLSHGVLTEVWEAGLTNRESGWYKAQQSVEVVPAARSRRSPMRRQTRRSVLSDLRGRFRRVDFVFLASTNSANARDGTSSTDCDPVTLERHSLEMPPHVRTWLWR